MLAALPLAAADVEPPLEGWHPVGGSKEGIEMTASLTDDEIWLRVVATASYPREQVCRVLSAVDRYAEWYPGLVDATALEPVEPAPAAQPESTGRIYGRFEPPWPFKPRDFVAEQRWSWSGQDLTLESRGVEATEVPPRDGVVRLRNLFMRFRLTDLGDRTRLEFIYREPADPWYRRILIRMLTRFARDLITNLERSGPAIAAEAATPPCALSHPQAALASPIGRDRDRRVTQRRPES